MSDLVNPVGTRAIARDAVRARISEVAVDLFDEHGFDNVTVEQIAAAVGVSARSVHRYFPAKEDTVIGDPAGWGEHVRDQLASRPSEEPLWDALLASYEALLLTPSRNEAQGRKAMRVLGSTPALRARNLEKHLLWARLLTPIVAERLEGNHRELRAETIVQASLACFDIALTAWAEADAVESSVELLRRSFGALQPTA
ncbi:TetR family transcriptional regulator [Demequina mangrovi]|uniref:Transcriptional regulator, TetR family n=1 Tax=Demequina mangrovi TaxID=1043493 RepID=A0A1H6Y0H3_9MICO|nr:TetR family transcriptional regulator [Demequina mangrovi]SEJ34761.1 transcriptional regulator, TetR family [Demequina mangrovi]